MSKYRYPRRYRQRYVNDAETLDQKLARRLASEVALEPTIPKEATSRPCMSDLEAYGAVCPSRDGPECDVWCARSIARQSIILQARLAAALARSGV